MSNRIARPPWLCCSVFSCLHLGVLDSVSFYNYRLVAPTFSQHNAVLVCLIHPVSTQSLRFMSQSWSHIKEQCVFPVMEFTGLESRRGPTHKLYYLFWGCGEMWSSDVGRIVEPTYGLTGGEQPGLLRSAQDPLALLRSHTHGQTHMPMCRGCRQRHGYTW